MHGQIHFLLCWKHVFLLDLEPGPQDASARFSSVFFLPVTSVEAGNPLQIRNKGAPQIPASLAAALGPVLFLFLNIPQSGSVDAGFPGASPFKLQTRELSG